MKKQIADFPGSIGIGTWKIESKKKMEIALHTAIENGCRVIDTASIYKNEDLVGRVIAQLPMKREELFIQGKVWNKDRGYEKTLRAFDRTMKNLALSYLDCYMIHWPASPIFDREWESVNAETYRAIEHLVEEKAVRTVGLCNFTVEHMESLKKTANRKPFVNQIELHPGCCQTEISDYCRKEGIALQAWSPLGNGVLLKHRELNRLAERYDVSPAKLCILWAKQRGIFPIVKSVTEERIRENCQQVSVMISKDDMKVLNHFSTGSRNE